MQNISHSTKAESPYHPFHAIIALYAIFIANYTQCVFFISWFFILISCNLQNTTVLGKMENQIVILKKYLELITCL